MDDDSKDAETAIMGPYQEKSKAFPSLKNKTPRVYSLCSHLTMPYWGATCRLFLLSPHDFHSNPLCVLHLLLLHSVSIPQALQIYRDWLWVHFAKEKKLKWYSAIRGSAGLYAAVMMFIFHFPYWSLIRCVVVLGAGVAGAQGFFESRHPRVLWPCSSYTAIHVLCWVLDLPDYCVHICPVHRLYDLHSIPCTMGPCKRWGSSWNEWGMLNARIFMRLLFWDWYSFFVPQI
jgi:hypothetical protein